MTNNSVIERKVENIIKRQNHMKITRMENPTHDKYIYYTNLKLDKETIHNIGNISGIVNRSVQVDEKIRSTTLTNRKEHCLSFSVYRRLDGKDRFRIVMTNRTEKIIIALTLTACLFVLGFFVGNLL